MIALVLSMMAARARQAVILLLLSVFATAAAVAAPAFLDSVHRAVVVTEARQAAPRELMLRTSLEPVAYPPDRRVLEDAGPTMLSVPGFARVFYAQIPIVGVEPDDAADTSSQLMFREDACEHLRILRGRCLMGTPELVVGERTAGRLGLAPGDAVTVRYAVYSEELRRYIPAGVPAELSVVGVYRPADPDDRYWGAHGYFPPGGGEPLFVGRRTLESVDHPTEYQGFDAMAGPAALTADTLVAVEAAYADAVDEFRDLSGNSEAGSIRIDSELPALLARIRADRAATAQLVPLAAVPLVGLCWFVIFLAVGYSAAGRREEIGLVALRGAGRLRRWWLALGEAALPVLAGAPLGYLAGHLLVRVSVAAAWDVPVDAPLTARSLPYAGAAVLGAVLACVLAQWRALSTPVVELLRGVPGRAGRWRGWAGDAIVVVGAVAAVGQLRATPTELAGVTLLVPALIMLAVALFGARAVAPTAGALAGRALRAGRLGLGLAAVQLARRPGSQRLLALLVVAVAMLTFTAMAVDVGTQARADRARIELGADRVLSLAPVSRQKLLTAVRAVDPAGEYAMAVTGAPSGGPNELPKLAVDATRLGRVAAAHPSGATGWEELGRQLRPAVAETVVVRGTGLALRATVNEVSADEVTLSADLRPFDGGPSVRAEFGALAMGTHTYAARTPGCSAGCRLAGLIVRPRLEGSYQTAFTLHDLRQTGPDAPVVDGPGFADPARWRGVRWRDGRGGPRLSAAADGTRVATLGDIGMAGEIRAADAPPALPVLATAPLPADGVISGLDGEDVRGTLVAGPPDLPRLGDRGLLMDLEYAERLAGSGGAADRPEVWLTAAAPPDVVARLTGAGLNVLGDQSRADLRTRLDRQGSAVSLRFHLAAAALAVALGAAAMWLMATVDRRRRSDELRALRVQGVPARAVGRASLWSYLGVVLVALLLGPVAAAAAWWAVGDRLPVFVDDVLTVTPPAWPAPLPVALAWSVAAILLVAVSALAAATVRRAVGAGRMP
jgi:hypothetical protein